MIFKSKKQDVIQDEASECGLACITYISDYYGKKLNLAQLRNKYDVPSEGLSFFHLMKICAEHKMIATGVNVTPEHLQELKTPAILLWNNCHFVVLKKTKNNKIEVMDPAVGTRFFTEMECSCFFSGVALEIIPESGFLDIKVNADNKKEKEHSYTNKSIYWGIFKYKAYIVPFILLSIIIQTTNIAIPKFMSLVFDEVLPQNDEDFLWLLVYIFGFIYLINAIAGYFKIVVSQKLRRYISWSEGLSVIQRLYNKDAKYFSKRMPSDILRKIKAIDVIHILYTQGWVDIIIDSFFTVILLVLLFFISPMLTLLTVSITAIMVLIRFTLLPAIMSKQHSSLEAEIKRDNSLLTAIDDIREIKLSHSEYKRTNKWSRHHADIEYNRSSIEKLNSFIELSVNTISHVQTLIITGFGAYCVLKGENTAGQLISYVFYKNIIMGNIQSVVEKHVNIKLCSVELKRLNDLSENEYVHNEEFKSSALEKDEKIIKVEAKNISFSYSNLEECFIKNIKFTICDNEKIVIAGPSGCGKTTVLNILCGLLIPSNGKILINDIPLAKFGIQQYHKQIAMVSSDDKIINGNITENIIHESEHYDMALLEECIDRTGLCEVIPKLHAGLNTKLGVNGTQLSSGQQQRMMFARALYKKPRLLLLDEPTSHLDKEARNLIISLICSLPMMCIIVSHDDELINIIDNKVNIC